MKGRAHAGTPQTPLESRRAFSRRVGRKAGKRLNGAGRGPTAKAETAGLDKSPKTVRGGLKAGEEVSGGSVSARTARARPSTRIAALCLFMAALMVLTAIVITAPDAEAQHVIGEYRGTDSNLLALWHLNETIGTSVLDSTFRGHNGTAYGLTWSYNAKYASSGYFNPATNAYIDIPHSAELNLVEPFTISMWINPDYVASANGVLIQKTNAYLVSIPSANTIRFTFNKAAGGTTSHSVSGSIVANMWQKIAVEKTATTVKIWVNDYLVYSAAETNAILTTSTNTLTLGVGGTSYYKGYLDEIALWNRTYIPHRPTNLVSILITPPPLYDHELITFDYYLYDQFGPRGESITVKLYNNTANESSPENWTLLETQVLPNVGGFDTHTFHLLYGEYKMFSYATNYPYVNDTYYFGIIYDVSPPGGGGGDDYYINNTWFNQTWYNSWVNTSSYNYSNTWLNTTYLNYSWWNWTQINQSWVNQTFLWDNHTETWYFTHDNYTYIWDNSTHQFINYTYLYNQTFDNDTYNTWTYTYDNDTWTLHYNNWSYMWDNRTWDNRSYYYDNRSWYYDNSTVNNFYADYDNQTWVWYNYTYDWDNDSWITYNYYYNNSYHNDTYNYDGGAGEDEGDNNTFIFNFPFEFPEWAIMLFNRTITGIQVCCVMVLAIVCIGAFYWVRGNLIYGARQTPRSYRAAPRVRTATAPKPRPRRVKRRRNK